MCEIKKKILSQLDSHLGIGIALYEFDSLNFVYDNEQFSSWFPTIGDQISLEYRIPELKTDRLIKRLSKGRSYEFEHEINDGPRKKILKLSASKITESEFSYVLVKVIDYTKEKEMEFMMDSYAKIAERNKRDLEKALKKIQDQNNRMLRELDIARQVQMGMLPFNFNPNNKNIEFAALLKPAKEVGGDFFDIFYIDEDNLCICLGDVSDKGAGSALFMAATKTLIKSHAMNAKSVTGIASRVNNELSINNDKCMFATLFLGILNIQTGELLYSNCGHCQPIILDENNRTKKLKELNGPAIGVMADVPFSEQQLTITKNQSLVIYSDGITESFNSHGEMYSEGRLNNELKNSAKNLTPEKTIDLIFNSVVEFESGTDQTDDITLLIVKYLA